ncbi:MAG: hypothetical protein Q8M71_01805 [Thermodesulfovibrionales bacterium]|nr:hypothetical protein [Thermodesulfovibrionales bacterium]
MKTSATLTFTRLDHIISVQDIMTQEKALKRADTIENATHLFKEYDVVPYPKAGKIRGFFRRKIEELIYLRPENLISDSTSLLDLPQLLEQDSFRFVISANEIAGYVHYSDLNEPPMKIPLFVLFQEMEKSLWDRIKGRITEDIIHEVFKNQAKEYVKERNKARRSNVNVDTGWTGVFCLPAILSLAWHFKEFKKIELSDDKIKLLRTIRNKIAHADRNLINGHADIRQLVEAIHLCEAVSKS